MSAENDLEIGIESLLGLTRTGLVERVDCVNHMNDGTQMTGFIVTFHYADGTTSSSNAQGPWGQGGGTSVYSLDRCVKWTNIQIGARRPSGNVEIITGQSSSQAPSGTCKAVEGYGLVPAELFDEQRATVAQDLPITVSTTP